MRLTSAALAGLLVCSMLAGAGEEPGTKTHTVTIEGMRFQPETLAVARGDTIVWVNKDVVPHTATSEADRFDSEIIQAGDSWTLVVRRKGKFAYVCTFHPLMRATLHVK